MVCFRPILLTDVYVRSLLRLLRDIRRDRMGVRVMLARARRSDVERGE